MQAIKKSVVLIMGLMAVLAGCGHRGMYHHGGMREAYGADRSQEIMAAVEKAVPDPEKAKRVQEALKEIMEEVRQSFKQTRELHRKLYELNANYHATPEEFTKILDDLHNGRMRTGARILATRFKIKDMLTAEEWKALTDNLNSVRLRYLHGYGAQAGEGTGEERRTGGGS